MKLNVLLFFTSILITLGLSEVVVRVSEIAPEVYRLNPGARESAFRLSEDPILGYELKENYRSSKPNYHQTFPYTNSHGQRDIERSLNKDPNVKRVIMLGDSVVAGHGIVELKHLPNIQLEKQLGKSFEVLNFGVGGYCTKAEVQLLENKGLQFKPDMVLVLFVDNDYVNRNANILHRLKKEGQVEHGPLVKSLFFNSHLFRYLSIQHNLAGLGDEFKDRFLENGNAIGDNNVEEGLKKLKALSELHGFKTTIALWPNFNKRSIFYNLPNGGPLREDEQLPVEKIAASLGLETVRLVDAFREDFKDKLEKRTSLREPQPGWIYTIGDGTHASRAGSRALGKILAPIVRARLS